MLDLRNIFLLFMMYSLIGWFIEIMNVYVLSKKIINRGFLIGPYCPIYGSGSVIVTLLLPNNTDLFGTFAKSMIICVLLEYITSYLMEKIFNKRWWDYTTNKFNINGRVCLETAILFGIGGCILIKYANPFFLGIINNVNQNVLDITSTLLLIIFLLDLIVSFKIISKFRKNSTLLYKDSTEEIKVRVREVLVNNYFVKRLVNAFPNLKDSKLRKK